MVFCRQVEFPGKTVVSGIRWQGLAFSQNGLSGGHDFYITASGKWDCTNVAAFCCCLFCLIQLSISQGTPWEYKPSKKHIHLSALCYACDGSTFRFNSLSAALTKCCWPPQLQRWGHFPCKYLGESAEQLGKSWLCKLGGTLGHWQPQHEVSGAVAKLRCW